MKKFNFEMQQVLDFRNFEKQQAESELAKALAVEAEINNNLEILAKQYAAVKQELNGSVDFSFVVQQNQFLNLLNFQKEELLKQLAEAKLVSDEKRVILQECMKKTSALEKLRENQLEAYKTAVDKEDEEAIDDFSTMNYRKNTNSPLQPPSLK